MGRLVRDLNPTLRGLLIVAAVSGVIVVLRLQSALVAVSLLFQIAFLLAIAFFGYLVWRDNRHEISMWPGRAQVALYAAAAVIVVDVGAFWWQRPGGADALAFFLVLGACGYALFRVWREQRTYS